MICKGVAACAAAPFFAETVVSLGEMRYSIKIA